MAIDANTINRAPVSTWWAAIVAERLGFTHDEALTLGRPVAGLNAYSKGRALGIFKPMPKDVHAKREAKAKGKDVLQVELLHRAVPVVQTPEGLRALSKEQPIAAASVDTYLSSKFKDALGPVSAAMGELADSMDREQLASEAYGLDEQFRPAIPAGEGGLGSGGDAQLGENPEIGEREMSRQPWVRYGRAEMEDMLEEFARLRADGVAVVRASRLRISTSCSGYGSCRG